MTGSSHVAAGPGSDLLELLERGGATAYLGEPVTLLEHSLQCAALASAAGHPPELVAACLLHDVGWLLGGDRRAAARSVGGDPGGGEGPSTASHHAGERPGAGHAERGAALLARCLPPAVSEPVRLHVLAKRWLATVDRDFTEALSAQSRRTLLLQGGRLCPEEAEAFEACPYGAAAVRLRRHDDDAKVPGRRCPPLEAYAVLLDELAASRPASAQLGDTG